MSTRINRCIISFVVIIGVWPIVSVAFTPVLAQRAAAGCRTAQSPAGRPKSPPPPLRHRGDVSSAPTNAESLAQVQPICPEGMVPLPKEFAPDASGLRKGNPLLRPSDGSGSLPGLGGAALPRYRTFDEVYGPQRNSAPASRDPKCDGVPNEDGCYYYAGAALHKTMTGAGMIFSIERPRYFGLNDATGHTLAEMSVQGGAEDGDIVEIGWKVSNYQYDGNPDPHLFVFHWKNWQGTCFDGCGWVQVSRTIAPGQSLRALVGKQIFVAFALHDGDWWAWFGDDWIGYFPGSEWGGRFNQAQTVQWYAEVASTNGVPPRTQMGSGSFPTDKTGALLTNLCLVDATSGDCPAEEPREVEVTPSEAAKYYQIKRVGDSDVRYGGPGR